MVTDNPKTQKRIMVKNNSEASLSDVDYDQISLSRLKSGSAYLLVDLVSLAPLSILVWSLRTNFLEAINWSLLIVIEQL